MKDEAPLPRAGRVGLYGGSFDPVHNAHLALARAALQALSLEQLRWIPAGLAWQKGAAHAGAEDRVAMLELAIVGEPRFVVDRRELRRSGPSYTLQTVRELAAAAPAVQWFLVIGQDQYRGLHTWHGWRELLPLVTVAVAGRAGEAPRPSDEVAAVPHRMRAIPLPPMADSATEVRRRVATGMPIADLVPPEVAGYIDRRGLYRPDTRS